MLHTLWNIMGVIGMTTILATIVILIHCYFATRDLYNQMKQINNKIGKDD